MEHGYQPVAAHPNDTDGVMRHNKSSSKVNHLAKTGPLKLRDRTDITNNRLTKNCWYNLVCIQYYIYIVIYIYCMYNVCWLNAVKSPI